MFYLSYMAAELRRRKGRTMLTALGLGVGVGLVVAVSALSSGLDRAQDRVLEPLTGVGTDMSVTRPVRPGEADGAGPGRARLDLAEAGEPGEPFTRTNFIATQMDLPAARVDDIRGVGGVEDAAGALTLTAMTVSGTVPEGGGLRIGPGPGAGGDPHSLDLDARTVTGMDVSKPQLAPMGPGDVTAGSYLRSGSKQVLLNEAYAKRNDLAVGDRISLGDARLEVVGLVKSPLGGQASDLYVDLERLQALADREGRVNTVQVRATDSGAVPRVEKAIGNVLEGASVTTAADLADRIGGSLTDAKALSDKLGVALTIVALVAAFLIASLLTLSSVSKRVRELGTLKALGWTQAKVVRQVTGESLAQGALGGLIGAAIGLGAAAAIGAAGITLQATVDPNEGAGGGPRLIGPGGGAPGAGPPGGGGFGQGAVQSGSTQIPLDAPADIGLVVLAVSLALLGGLIAGSLGGLRAARLRPAAALRHLG